MVEFKKCQDCKWFSPALLVCFHDANEGMRVFSGMQKACEWINKPMINKELREQYGDNEDNCM